MSVFIIAEAGVNHNGSIKIAKELIDVAVNSGANAVKFQTFKASSLVSKNAKKAQYQKENMNTVDDSQYSMLKKLELDTSPNNIPLAEQLSMGDEAFGSKAFLFNLLNIGLEVVQLPAVFDETKSASDAVKSLNQQFETVFLAAQNIRDSVFQGKKLEALTPDPLKFWMGPDAARSKALILYERLNGEIERMENSLDDPEIFLKQTGTEDSVGTKLQRLPVLKDLRDGYGLLAQIDLAARGLDPDILKQNQQEKTLLDELDAASGVKN